MDKRIKKELYSSRINAANLLKSYCEKYQIKLKSFISASGINYYGTFTSDEISLKIRPSKTRFLAELSVDWEKSAYQFSEISERVVLS